MSRIMARVLLSIVMFEEISCQWMLDLNMVAFVSFVGEVVGDDYYCCCDTDICTRNLGQLLGCPSNYQCQVEVTIKLSDCKTCPSVCCLIYDVGSKLIITIADASFQINGDPSRMGEPSVNVTIRETDGTFESHIMDTIKLTPPYRQTTEFTENPEVPGTFGLVKFTFSYLYSLSAMNVVEETSYAVLTGPSMSSVSSVSSMACHTHKVWTTSTVVFTVLYNESVNITPQTGVPVTHVVMIMAIVVVVITTVAIFTGALLCRRKAQKDSNESHKKAMTDSHGACRPKEMKKVSSQHSTCYYMHNVSTKEPEEAPDRIHDEQIYADMDDDNIYEEVERKHMDQRRTVKREADPDVVQSDVCAHVEDDTVYENQGEKDVQIYEAFN